MEKKNFSSVHYIIHNEKFIPLKELRSYCISEKGKVFNLDTNSFERTYKGKTTQGTVYHVYRLEYLGKDYEFRIGKILKEHFKIKDRHKIKQIIRELVQFLNTNFERNFKRNDEVLETERRFYGDRLMMLMELNKIDSDAFAFEIQVAKETLQWYIRSLRKPNNQVLTRICNFFNVTKSFFDQKEVELIIGLKINDKKYNYTTNDLLCN